MQELRHSDESTGRGVLSFIRGAFLGMLGVAAIAAWAVNLDIVLSGNGAGPFANALRLVICDAIPVATLCAIYRSLGKNSSIEGTVHSILGTIFWLPRVLRRPASVDRKATQADMF